MRYLVSWSIDSDASTPVEAAREAWDAMRRADSIANVFTVTDTDTKVDTLIDLQDYDADVECTCEPSVNHPSEHAAYCPQRSREEN